MSVNIGDKAPDFTLPTDGGGSVTLSKLQGKPVVLYFYPKDDTSGCTAEACGFRDSFPDYGKTGATVIGISKDSVASHDKFKAKYQLPFTLGSDADGKVVESYGVWVEKSMYGRKYMGIERATFLIDKGGVVRGVWHKVKVPGHVAEVLKAAQGALNATLASSAVAILATADPAEKSALSRALAARWREGGMAVGAATPPGRPARPERPALHPPRDMPRRRNVGALAGRIALDPRAGPYRAQRDRPRLGHRRAVLRRRPAAGILRRLGGRRRRGGRAFRAAARRGFARSAANMARCRRMTGCGKRRMRPRGDLLARLAVVPLVLEARGLDVTPAMIPRLENAGDRESAAILRRIYDDEIGHVACWRALVQTFAVPRAGSTRPQHSKTECAAISAAR